MRSAALLGNWMRTLVGAISLSLLAISCGGPSGDSVADPTRVSVQTRLENRLSTDAHATLCEELAAGFSAGNRDTIAPHFDYASFVERVIALRPLPVEVSEALRANPVRENFARLHYPDGSRFLCLGTRTYRGETWIALRQWTDERFDYELFRLSGGAVPIDDWLVVSAGDSHSLTNAFYFDPALQAGMEREGELLMMSYDGRFREAITGYRNLPAEIRALPSTFLHFINSVFTTEQTGSPLYEEAVGMMPTIYADAPYALAYWRFADARRRGDENLRKQARDVLLELLDDYELFSR